MKLGGSSGIGDDIKMLKIGTFTLDPPSVLASLSGDTTVTIPGLDVASNWVVLVQPLSANLSSGLGIASARVSADDTLTVRFMNSSILAIDNASQTFSYLAVK